MIHPLPPAYRRITQRFGENPADYAPYGLAGHEGLDISCPIGTPVYAAHDGLVNVMWAEKTYGLYVCLWGEGLMTLYAHLSRSVPEGTRAKVGDTIAWSGNSGRTTGPHLHLGLYPLPRDWGNGYKGAVDPEKQLEERMGTKLAAHVQNLNEATIDHLRRAVYPALKFMSHVDPAVVRDRVLPAYEGRAKPFIWVRKWTDDITGDCVRAGSMGGKRWRDAVIADYSRWRNALGCETVELDNEIICWTEDDAKRHNAFETEAIRLLASDGFASVALNASVGWPKLEHWQYYRETLATAAYIGLHEYGWPANNAEGKDLRYFDWHVLRYRRAYQTIRDLGYRLPPILLTEIGWEGALIGMGHRGFRMPGIDQNGYLDWLRWYDGEIGGDARVRYASIFQTGADPDWQEMDAVGSRIDGALAEYVRERYQEEPMADTEVTQLKAMLAVIPATQKACVERGYDFLREVYQAGDAHARAIAYDPRRQKYLGLWLDSRTWRVVRTEELAGAMTL